MEMPEFKKIMADPFYCITVHYMYTQDHPYLVSREDFVKVAVRNMTEDDDGKKLELPEIESKIAEYMNRLLDNLEGKNLQVEADNG